MCAPTLAAGLLGFGQSMAGSAANLDQQKKQYAAELAQNEILRRQQQDESQTRAAAAVLNYQQIQLAEREANDSAVQQKMDTARSLQKARALTKLSAMEGGVGGNVVDRAMVDLGFTEGQKMGAIEATRESQMDQLESEKIATYLSSKVQPIYTATGKAPKMGLSDILAGALGGFTGYVNADGLRRKSSYDSKVSETGSFTVRRFN